MDTSKDTSKFRFPFFELPAELQLLVLENAGLTELVLLRRVSKGMKELIDTKKYIERHFIPYYPKEAECSNSTLRKVLKRDAKILESDDRMLEKDIEALKLRFIDALQVHFLLHIPRGKRCYDELHAIHHNEQTTDDEKKVQFEEKAKESATAARLILAHDEFWSFIEDPQEQAEFINNIMGDWVVAFYDVLATQTLRQRWRPFLVWRPFLGSTSSVEERQGALFAFCSYTETAWFLSKNPEVLEQLWQETLGPEDSDVDNRFLGECIKAILSSRPFSQSIAYLWSTHPKCKALLDQVHTYELARCIEAIFVARDQESPLPALWLKDPELQALIMRVARAGTQMAFNPFHNASEEFAISCCQDSYWQGFLRTLVNNQFYHDVTSYIKGILAAGQQEAATLLSTTPAVRDDVIAKLPELQSRHDCLKAFLTVAAEGHVRETIESGFSENPTLKGDLESIASAAIERPMQSLSL